MLIATDDALKSTINPGRYDYYHIASEVAERKYRVAIDLLSDFAKDFPPKDLTSDPNIQANIGGTVTGKVKMSVKSKSPLMILEALKTDLRSNVKFPFVSLSFDTDGYQPMRYNPWRLSPREVGFHILSSLHDPHPIFVRRGCHAIDFPPVSDSSASDAHRQFEPSRDSAVSLPF